MSKINWKRKLTSRKFWVTIGSSIAMMGAAFGLSSEATTEIVGLVMAGGTAIAYIIGEGLVDYSNANSSNTNTEDTTNNDCE